MTLGLLQMLPGVDRARMIVRKSLSELEKMRRSGLLVYQILKDLEAMVHEGVSTQDLEVAAEKMVRDAGAKPAFKGYSTQAAGAKFPFVLCTSVNDEIVHGMPSQKRKLKRGDIVSIDTGVQLDGYYGDSAITVPVGEISEETKRLLRGDAGIAGTGHRSGARPGNRLFDISGTVEKHVTRTDSRLCGSLWAMASERSCTRSRRFRISWTGGIRIRG